MERRYKMSEKEKNVNDVDLENVLRFSHACHDAVGIRTVDNDCIHPLCNHVLHQLHLLLNRV